jgi:hypothetical protein
MNLASVVSFGIDFAEGENFKLYTKAMWRYYFRQYGDIFIVRVNKWRHYFAQTVGLLYT